MNMDNVDISRIDFIHNNCQDIIWTKTKCLLSHMSRITAHNIFKNDVNIIFTQTDFKMIPLICALYAKTVQKDILIGMPTPIGTNFQRRYDEYTKNFFSLLSKGKFFFYQDALWLEGRVGDEDTIEKLVIEKRPFHGKYHFKEEYEKFVNLQLENDGFQKLPKIISIPLKSHLPFYNFENVNLKFKKDNYHLKQFDPGLIILESINERQFSFNSLINLIDTFEEQDKKIILHFSWPYVPNQTKFLNEVIDKYPDANVLHMGKILCNKINEKIKEKKPKDYALPLSLEGELWESTYKTDVTSLKKKIHHILPNIYRYSVNDLKGIDFTIDHISYKIDNMLKNEEDIIENAYYNVLKYPPIVNTFLSPDKMTMYYHDYKRYLPIGNAIEEKIEDEELVKQYRGIESELYSFDIVNHFKGIMTPKKVRKRTLLQLYLVDTILNIRPKLKIDSIFIANLHPSFGTISHTNMEIQRFLSVIETKLKCTHDYLINNSYLDITMVERFSNENDLNVIKETKSNVTKMKLITNIPVNCIYGNHGEDIYFPYHPKPIIAELEFHGERLRKISVLLLEFENKFNEHIVKINVIKKINSDIIIQRTERYSIKYKNLFEFRDIALDDIRRSVLLVPGPIPFHTIKEGKILISQGYDSFLLPFNQIVMFSYPGNNFTAVLNQIKSFESLLSNDGSKICNKDLAYSLKYTNMDMGSDIFNNISVEDVEREIGNDSPLDGIIRSDLLEREDGQENKESLERIFDEISKRDLDTRLSQTTTTFYSDTSYVKFRVEFVDGTEKTIDFSEGSLIRTLVGNDYVLSPVEEICVGDKIIYVGDRNTLDNELLLQFFSHVNYDLESVLEPLTKLRVFYEVLKQTNFSGEYIHHTVKSVRMDGTRFDKEVNPFNRLKWLAPEQREVLFYLLKSGLEDNYEDYSSYYEKEDNIWGNYIDKDVLWNIFFLERNIGQNLLSRIAKKLGLTLANSTFKIYCSKAIADQNHYFFNDSINVKVIGKLIGHERIIQNYEEINEHGRDITSVLIRIGRSISRNVTGTSRDGHEIDMYVGKRLKECVVKDIEKDED